MLELHSAKCRKLWNRVFDGAMLWTDNEQSWLAWSPNNAFEPFASVCNRALKLDRLKPKQCFQMAWCEVCFCNNGALQWGVYLHHCAMEKLSNGFFLPTLCSYHPAPHPFVDLQLESRCLADQNNANLATALAKATQLILHSDSG